MKTEKKPVVIIAGGGTGGHIYPGVAIARAILRDHPEYEVHFVGAYGGLEEKIIPREKLPLHLVAVGKLHKSVGLKVRLKTLLQLPLSLWQSAKILHSLRPVSVLGVGGFASGPVLFMAVLMGYRCLLWEPNAHPGLTNRLMSRWVRECLVVFEEAARYLHSKHVIKSGVPIRSSIAKTLCQEPPTAKIEAAEKGSDARRDDDGGVSAILQGGVTKSDGSFSAAPPSPLRVLVFGGSQGARAINSVVAESVSQGGSWLDGIELVHQTGAPDFQRVSEAYKSAPPQISCFEYLHDMDARYAWADLIVCRSGASTVAEICAASRAAVFVPLPTAADNHQLRNAEVLVRGKAARLILQKDFTAQAFKNLILEFRDQREKIVELEKNVSQFYFADADRQIADRLLGDA
jgi:UDP-N-acetylglucosamine--N-acetylmuramyl-(pentapeptide) pyrophosphoryl-undecaprenol N-acetylglucosamine transferase